MKTYYDVILMANVEVQIFHTDSQVEDAKHCSCTHCRVHGTSLKKKLPGFLILNIDLTVQDIVPREGGLCI